jgi:hypothetical protein
MLSSGFFAVSSNEKLSTVSERLCLLASEMVGSSTSVSLHEPMQKLFGARLPQFLHLCSIAFNRQIATNDFNDQSSLYDMEQFVVSSLSLTHLPTVQNGASRSNVHGVSVCVGEGENTRKQM